VRGGLAVGTVLVLGIPVLLGFRLPFMPCGFHAMTGLPCLFCGGTRAAGAILHGQWKAALYLNGLAFPAVLALGVIVAVLLVEALGGRCLAPWGDLGRRLGRFAPLLILLGLVWWIPHLYLALHTPKPELVDLKNPIAARARALLGR